MDLLVSTALCSPISAGQLTAKEFFYHLLREAVRYNRLPTGVVFKQNSSFSICIVMYMYTHIYIHMHTHMLCRFYVTKPQFPTAEKSFLDMSGKKKFFNCLPELII